MRIVRAIDARIPGLTYNRGQGERFKEFGALVTASDGQKRILVVGAGTAGVLISHPDVKTILTDVIDAPGIDIVCDAHHLPFEDASFDAVMAVAVLEHVADPNRVAGEIHRVLKHDGLVYSEIPFLQRVHAGAWDFTRFTMLGHRRLFRMFDTVKLVPIAGPASSLAWALNGFALALFGRTRMLWYASDRASRLLFCWLPPLDRLLIGAPAAGDSACGTAFVGRRRALPVDDEAVLLEYCGAVPTPGAKNGQFI